MKRVFSLKKFIHECIIYGETEKQIKASINTWATKCDGKTEKEVRNYKFEDEWCDEVEEE